MIVRFLLTAAVLTAAALAQLSAEQSARAQHLQSVLLAPCCYSEPVAIHRSDAALAMKAEIERLVGEGKSDAEILGLYKQRHGLRILIEPEGGRWWWANVIPLVAAALGLVVVVVAIRKLRRPLPAPS